MYAIFSVKKNNVGKADEILKDDIVSRQSIAIRDASALGIDSENRYILIEGNKDVIKRAEELFKRVKRAEVGGKITEEEEVAEKEIGEGVEIEPEEELPKAAEEKAEEAPKKEIGEKLPEKKAKEIYDKIKKEEENVAEGVGFVFGE